MELIGSWYEFESDVGTSGARTEESDIDTSSLFTRELWDFVYEVTAERGKSVWANGFVPTQS
jgi:hypothetical protein